MISYSFETGPFILCIILGQHHIIADLFPVPLVCTRVKPTTRGNDTGLTEKPIFTRVNILNNSKSAWWLMKRATV